jgi:hypothetical protein
MIGQTRSARDKRFGRFQHGMRIERGVFARAREDDEIVDASITRNSAMMAGC